MDPPTTVNSIRLNLRVSPGASRTAIVGPHGDGWKIRVVAAPERGRANESVVAFLATTLGLRRPDVRIISGTSSRNKTVELVGLTRDEAERRLNDAQEGAE